MQCNVILYNEVRSIACLSCCQCIVTFLQ